MTQSAFKQYSINHTKFVTINIVRIPCMPAHVDRISPVTAWEREKASRFSLAVRKAYVARRAEDASQNAAAPEGTRFFCSLSLSLSLRCRCPKGIPYFSASTTPRLRGIEQISSLIPGACSGAFKFRRKHPASLRKIPTISRCTGFSQRAGHDKPLRDTQRA